MRVVVTGRWNSSASLVSAAALSEETTPPPA